MKSNIFQQCYKIRLQEQEKLQEAASQAVRGIWDTAKGWGKRGLNFIGRGLTNLDSAIGEFGGNLSAKAQDKLKASEEKNRISKEHNDWVEKKNKWINAGKPPEGDPGPDPQLKYAAEAGGQTQDAAQDATPPEPAPRPPRKRGGGRRQRSGNPPADTGSGGGGGLFGDQSGSNPPAGSDAAGPNPGGSSSAVQLKNQPKAPVNPERAQNLANILKHDMEAYKDININTVLEAINLSDLQESAMFRKCYQIRQQVLN